LFVLYIRIFKPTNAWIPWHPRAKEDWKPFLKEALPIAGCFYCEGLIFEINTIAAGLFSPL